jgi:hypothetical protein
MTYNQIQFLKPVLYIKVTAHADVTRLLSHAEVSEVRLRQSLIWFSHIVGKKAHLHQLLYRSQLGEGEERGRLEEEKKTSA